MLFLRNRTALSKQHRINDVLCIAHLNECDGRNDVSYIRINFNQNSLAAMQMEWKYEYHSERQLKAFVWL